MGLNDEADLVALLAADVNGSYEKLVAQFWHQLYTFVCRRTANPQDAEDIVQDAFVRAYLALARYPAQRILALRIRPWLYKITWNVYCTHAGKSLSPPHVPLDTSEEGPLLEQEGMWSEQPEMVFEQLERRGELDALVATLPERYREIISLYYFEELSQPEIADILNQSVGAIKVSVHRGIHLLRKALEIHTHEVR